MTIAAIEFCVTVIFGSVSMVMICYGIAVLARKFLRW